MKVLFMTAILVGCSAEGPIAPADDAGVEDVVYVEKADLPGESSPAPCERSTKVVVGDVVVVMPVPCREFDPLTDLGRPYR